MVEKNISQAKMAEMLGINVSSLNAKMNNKREFTIGEATKICSILNIDTPNEYFFIQ
nr:MAG TPA: Helix-turn-helix XRE-family like protein [Caudoviricetes sp.]